MAFESSSTISAEKLAKSLDDFDAIVDVRSPSEWDEDHLPGAINLPVLSNDERARIGTQYKESSFAAKRAGAALISRNIAALLERELSDKPRSWRPLIYCWRGGSRSQSLSTVLQAIGYKTRVLEGGYTEFRRFIRADLDRLGRKFTYRVICGVTGSGKSLLLRNLAQQKLQVLDLEALAHHRGSLLGSEPVGEQPSQKSFEMRIWNALRQAHSDEPIYVESESKKIGRVQVPDTLIEKMRASKCYELLPPIKSRVDFLCQEYAHFFQTPEVLITQLEKLLPLIGHERLNRWKALIDEQNWGALVESLLVEHYDPTYRRSMAKNYSKFAQATRIEKHAVDLSAKGLSVFRL